MDLSWRKATLDDVRIRLHGWLSRRQYHAALFSRTGSDDALAYALWQDRGNEVFLRHFFVSRAHRREGVGRNVMQLLEQQIWPRDRRIILEVLSGNGRGRHFWQALGYHPYSETLIKDASGSEQAARAAGTAAGPAARGSG